MSIIIGIESSCDDTSIAFVDLDGKLIDHETVSQAKIHAQFGGVVPEVASRNHIVNLQKIFQKMIHRNNILPKSIVAVCATGGPGLLGGLLVGLMFAKGLSISLRIPFIAVNHLEGHLFSAKIEDRNFNPPFLGLLISGGHCQILVCKALGEYILFGQTLDDAAGEAFDKTARMMGIEYPGGAKIEELATEGREIYRLTIPMRGRAMDMSFSGLKTNAKNLIEEVREKERGILSHQSMRDIALVIENTIAKSLEEKVEHAMKKYITEFPNFKRSFTVAGGVAANRKIRNMLQSLSEKYGFTMFVPSLKYCTDNAAMIAIVGLEYFKQNRFSVLDFKAVSRWDLC